MTPASAKDLQKLGYECVIETGAGAAAGFNDKTYKDAGVEVVKTAAALFKAADVVAKVRPPEDVEIKRLREGQTLISFFYPAQNKELMGRQRKRCHRDRDGYGAPHQPRAENGRAVVDGKYRRLPRCDRSG